ncbi:hypothetical protein MMC12_006488 [Toensbergia leucococca]|nr:hypothetical protein [Toensbergia leucococca]
MPLHVFDLPQLYSRPPAYVLLQALESLAVKPISWDSAIENDEEEEDEISEDGIPRYLTGIIKSPLAWIENEVEKEQIWESASMRLSERSGRTAAPSANRTLHIPTTTSSTPTIAIHLYEPSLTSDNLGHKTWSASYLLAKRLPHLLPYLPPLHSYPQNSSTTLAIQAPLPRVLELGAGTGLVGIAFAALFPTHVHLTDLTPIVPNLLTNVLANISHPSSTTTVGTLDWSNLSLAPDTSTSKYAIIVAADPLYSPSHPAWLVNTIGRHLARGAEARVVVELPLREAYMAEIGEFRARMTDLGLWLLVEGEEVGFDDWGSGSMDGRVEVKCWWGVWAWAD